MSSPPNERFVICVLFLLGGYHFCLTFVLGFYDTIGEEQQDIDSLSAGSWPRTRSPGRPSFFTGECSEGCWRAGGRHGQHRTCSTPTGSPLFSRSLLYLGQYCHSQDLLKSVHGETRQAEASTKRDMSHRASLYTASQAPMGEMSW